VSRLVSQVVADYNYWIVVVLMMIGFYILISRGNIIKKLVGLNVFQTSVFMLYISIGKISGGTAPILLSGGHGAAVEHGASSGQAVYSNPLPHVLILTAIVVGIATTSVGLALAVRIKEAYGTVEEDEINEVEAAMDGP